MTPKTKIASAGGAAAIQELRSVTGRRSDSLVESRLPALLLASAHRRSCPPSSGEQLTRPRGVELVAQALACHGGRRSGRGSRSGRPPAARAPPKCVVAATRPRITQV